MRVTSPKRSAIVVAKEEILRLTNPKRVAAGFKVLFGLLPPGRNLAVRLEDTFLVGYPRSGNTWARFLIAN